MSPQAQSYLRRLDNSFFGRWINNSKVSWLLIVLLLIYGLYSVIVIPKESAPDVKFGIVSISTVYPWANPIDIDDTITTKIEDKIQDLDGIDKIDSRSSLWVSSVTVTLENGVDVRDFITDARNAIDTVSLPNDVTTPRLIEISTSNEILFQMMIYGPKDEFSMNHLRTLAIQVRTDLKGKGSIVDIALWWSIEWPTAGGWSTSSIFDVQVLLNAQQLELLWLSVGQVLGQIRAYNQNLPLGNYQLGDLRYDYRIDNELRSLSDLQNIPIVLWGGRSISLADISDIVRHYRADTVIYGWEANIIDHHALELTVYKAPGGNIFNDAASAKELIEANFTKLPYQGLSYAYTRDLAEIIIQDYQSLWKNGLTSLVLVFAVILLFIGLRQSLIATFVMPLSYLIVFIILNEMGRTMNFMVNFSLIVAFGLGIDMIIVYIEAAWTNMKLWYNPKTAMLLAMKTYSKPNIISALTNLVVFIPMLTLPGIIGKFLSNIPITLFASLLATLFLALTLNGVLFVSFNKKLDHYTEPGEDDDTYALLSDEEREILNNERSGKKLSTNDDHSKVEQIIDRVKRWYGKLLSHLLGHTTQRRLVIGWSFAAVILSFVVLAPMIGFVLFPSGDNPSIDFAISAQEGTATDAMLQNAQGIDQVIGSLPEIKNYTISTSKNKIDIALTLLNQEDRQRDSFAVQAEVETKLAYLTQRGYILEWKVQAWGPPAGKAVGIQLVADNKDYLPQLRQVAQDFQTHLSSLTGTMNTTNSSTDSPGQFSFRFDAARLADLGLNPSDVQNEIYSAINGIKAGTLIVDREERDIVVKMDTFAGQVAPEQLYNLSIATRSGPVRLSQIATVDINPALTSIDRKEGDIVVTVESDLEQWLKPNEFQSQLEAFAMTYTFPRGISYKAWGENAANADLIQSAATWFLVAIFMTFVLLVYQFNSFSKPAIILYSIVMAFLGVNIGLFITGNPYSMSFAIGFIALTGIVVNTAIFLVDRINENTKKWLWLVESIVEAWQTRFKPIVITTATTIFGIASLVNQDEFYAGLGYTIIFGLLFSTVITLVGVPLLYYAGFSGKDDARDGITTRWKDRIVQWWEKIHNKYQHLWQYIQKK